MLLHSEAISEPTPGPLPPGTAGSLRYSRRQTVVNAATSWADMICQGVLGVLLVPLLIDRLGKDGFGVVCLLNVIIIYTSFADLGVRGAIGRDLSERVARNDARGFTSLLTMSVLLLLSVSGVLSLGLFIFRGSLVRLLEVPPSLEAAATSLIPFYCGGMLTLGFITPIFSSATAALNRFDVVNVIRMLITLAGNIILLFFLPHGPQAIYVWCFVLVATQLALFLVTLLSFVRICRPYLTSFSLPSFESMLSLVSFGGKVFGLTFFSMMGTQADPVILSAFMGPGAISIYNPAVRISAMVRPMVMVLAQTLCPMATSHHATNNTEQMQALLLKGTRYTMLFGALATVGVMSLAKPFCQLWLGGVLGEDALRVASILMLVAMVDFVDYAAGTQWPVLVGTRKIDFLLATTVPFTVVNLVLSIVLVGYAGVGISGVIIATLITSLLRRPLVIWHTASQCGVPLSTYITYSYVPALGITIVLAVIGVLVNASQPIRGWPTLMIHAGVLAVAWSPMAILFGIPKEDRVWLARACRGYVRRLAASSGGL
ncbi:MAG: oligosaccharide flippase family protein [Planctomycetota bacterium]